MVCARSGLAAFIVLGVAGEDVAETCGSVPTGTTWPLTPLTFTFTLTLFDCVIEPLMASVIDFIASMSFFNILSIEGIVGLNGATTAAGVNAGVSTMRGLAGELAA